MGTLAVRVRRAFLRAWKAYGQPTMTVVREIATWELPAGYAYDPVVDRVADVNHEILPNPEDYWVTADVYIVPDSHPEDTRSLVAQGILPEGTLVVGILEADAATLQAAHAIQVEGEWYDVANIETGIGGDWRRVRLTRRS